MLALLCLVCFIFFAAFVYYRFVIKPKRLIKYYKQIFEPNFKVHLYPFAIMKPGEYIISKADQQKHKDCFNYMKTVVSDFDVSITNIVDKVQINLVSPSLMQAFHQIDQEVNYEKQEMFVNSLRRMVGNGITFSKGQVWKMKRRILTKMLNFTYIKSLMPKISKIINNKIDSVLMTKQPREDGFYDFDALEFTTSIASTIILQLFFGGGYIVISDLKVNDTPVNVHVRQLLLLLEQQMTSNPLVLVLGQNYAQLGVTKLDRRINQLLTGFHKFTSNFVFKRLLELKRKYSQQKQFPEIYTDLIEAFFVQQILKKNLKVNQEFIQSLVDDFATLFIAGSDTTSYNSLMSIYYTFTNNEVKKELVNQLNKNVINFNQITYDTLKNCTYLESVICQTLRAYATVNGIFPREAKIDHYLTVGDIKIPIKKGTIVNPQNITTQYKQTIYKDPMTFNPHRFLDSEGRIKNPEPFTFMNFSAGSRGCIGRQLAMCEMKAILSILVHRCQVKVEDENKKMVHKAFAAHYQNVKYFFKPVS